MPTAAGSSFAALSAPPSRAHRPPWHNLVPTPPLSSSTPNLYYHQAPHPARAAPSGDNLCEEGEVVRSHRSADRGSRSTAARLHLRQRCSPKKGEVLPVNGEGEEVGGEGERGVKASGGTV
ncbi:hypothetical protein E2562_017935 [Oryza meyeriana var. granulata]|uniref:Uncharacterized protein n=1 Tax=Oryza meyeriana var. granulata TaxID=110450 RepID=A0A6G1CR12_9ORYZ|nr:hypothetical protein E2562_017935 [Oryza meyeriana var. granulata]